MELIVANLPIAGALIECNFQRLNGPHRLIIWCSGLAVSHDSAYIDFSVARRLHFNFKDSAFFGRFFDKSVLEHFLLIFWKFLITDSLHFDTYISNILTGVILKFCP